MKKAITQAYLDHLGAIERAFNSASAEAGLPVALDAGKVRQLSELDPVTLEEFAYAINFDDAGLIYEKQVRILPFYYREFLSRYERQIAFGHFSGSERSVKEKAGVCMQWLAPVSLLLCGKTVCPIYLTPGELAADEIGEAVVCFRRFYGDLELVNLQVRGAGGRITMRRYLDTHLKLSTPQIMAVGNRFREIERENKGGQIILRKIGKYLDKVADKGFWPMFVVNNLTCHDDVQKMIKVLKYHFAKKAPFWMTTFSTETMPRNLAHTIQYKLTDEKFSGT